MLILWANNISLHWSLGQLAWMLVLLRHYHHHHHCLVFVCCPKQKLFSYKALPFYDTYSHTLNPASRGKKHYLAFINACSFIHWRQPFNWASKLLAIFFENKIYPLWKFKPWKNLKRFNIQKKASKLIGIFGCFDPNFVRVILGHFWI